MSLLAPGHLGRFFSSSLPAPACSQLDVVFTSPWVGAGKRWESCRRQRCRRQRRRVAGRELVFRRCWERHGVTSGLERAGAHPAGRLRGSTERWEVSGAWPCLAALEGGVGFYRDASPRVSPAVKRPLRPAGSSRRCGLRIFCRETQAPETPAGAPGHPSFSLQQRNPERTECRALFQCPWTRWSPWKGNAPPFGFSPQPGQASLPDARAQETALSPPPGWWVGACLWLVAPVVATGAVGTFGKAARPWVWEKRPFRRSGAALAAVAPHFLGSLGAGHGRLGGLVAPRLGEASRSAQAGLFGQQRRWADAVLVLS